MTIVKLEKSDEPVSVKPAVNRPVNRLTDLDAAWSQFQAHNWSLGDVPINLGMSLLQSKSAIVRYTG